MPLDYMEAPHLTATELEALVNQIGNTPMRQISLVIEGKIRKTHLKLENLNPTGSMKDRTGLALIQYLEKQGRLHEESIVIESSSGNLGVALALQCKAKGYPFVAVIDPKTTQENIFKMKALGAAIEVVCQADAKGGYLLSRLAYVREMCCRDDRYIWTDQYSSPANPLAHYSSTGPEIYHQMGRQVDAIFVPVSTGGTLAGIGRFFREASPSTRIIGVDARGSVVFGTLPAERKLTGIGSSRRSTFLQGSLYDTYILVGDEEAFTFCRALYVSTGIKLGGSSGATLAACARYLADHPSIENVVCVCADRGENYDSSIFNDEWLYQQHVELSRESAGPVEQILPA
ncbi:MAG TPA: pyridoxal-phosphate dependent enzyme [Ktedonosporobacter sp.]|jgi:2,3-diaminopropionate biosynthesis protein SbnA|nr:pyridoxal-phosphate dependent enzyme [Ktedonosporobacter sp.]